MQRGARGGAAATNRKVAGSIPDGVIWIFRWPNPSGRPMALGSTQPLTEMSTRDFAWRVMAAGAYGYPYHLHMLIVWKSGCLNLLEPSRPVQTCPGFFFFTFYLRTVEKERGKMAIWWSHKKGWRQKDKGKKEGGDRWKKLKVLQLAD